MDTNENRLPYHIVEFYRAQLVKFKKIGIGNETEFKVVVTEKLINCTNKRIRETYSKTKFSPIY